MIYYSTGKALNWIEEKKEKKRFTVKDREEAYKIIEYLAGQLRIVTELNKKFLSHIDNEK